ncbi:hypothetical protein F504_635 [Ralstonia pseudosolanacearum FQY_4]|nr:hypothetical protein F504_635 [Ralstonia pseudosolanacearum FQY_4]
MRCVAQPVSRLVVAMAAVNTVRVMFMLNLSVQRQVPS